MVDSDPPELLAALLAADGRRLVRHVVCQVEPSAEGTIRGYAVTWEQAGRTGEDVVYLQPTTTAAQAGTVEVVDPDSGQRFRVWRYPDDPGLPALASAVHLDAVAVLLPRLGVPATPVGLELVSYRPGRRAVVRADLADSGCVYLKVVRPAQVELVHDKHRTLHDAGLPVPRPLGWSPAGLLPLDRLPGTPAAHVLPALGDDPELAIRLAALLQRFGAAVRPEWPARRTPPVAVDWFADQLARARPDLAARVHAVRDASRRAPEQPPVGIHGDLHLGQVLVDPDHPTRLLGILDVDTAGPGDPTDDACSLVTQLMAAALGPPDAYARAAAHAVPAWLRALAPPGLALGPRLAAHLLALALDPATRGDAGLTERVLARAEDVVDEKSFIVAFPPSHEAPPQW